MDYIREEFTRQRRVLEALLTGGGGGDAARNPTGAQTVFSRRSGEGPRPSAERRTTWLADGDAASREPEALGAWEAVRRRTAIFDSTSGTSRARAPEHGSNPAGQRSVPPPLWEARQPAEGTGGGPDAEGTQTARAWEQSIAAERIAPVPASGLPAAWRPGGGGDTSLPALMGRPAWLTEGAFTAAQPPRTETIEEPADMASVRTVSRAIQRDARRYDGGFMLY